jgi:hypothetical protein
LDRAAKAMIDGCKQNIQEGSGGEISMGAGGANLKRAE